MRNFLVCVLVGLVVGAALFAAFTPQKIAIHNGTKVSVGRDYTLRDQSECRFTVIMANDWFAISDVRSGTTASPQSDVPSDCHVEAVMTNYWQVRVLGEKPTIVLR